MLAGDEFYDDDVTSGPLPSAPHKLASPIFDEQALLADVAGVWGKYGAHFDLVASMIREITSLRMAGDNLAHAVASLHDALKEWEEVRRER